MTSKIEKCPTCGGDAVHRSEWWECCVENSTKQQTQLYEIKKAIRKYHLALDNRQHGDIAKSNAINEICEVLDMHWEQGKTTQWLKDNPALKKIYEKKSY